ncbi:hypothetical protein BASA81_006480 [Batrachochytrium salamandrivorans]|nr:hypothetical protein BASA81_006480 [Batrachochytrium salamandrivorans]
MVELQGELVSSTADDCRPGKLLGRIVHSDTSPQLVIGTSQLDGKRVKLSAPLAVLKRVQNGDETLYRKLGYVTEKYVFKTRPKPQSSAAGPS